MTQPMSEHTPKRGRHFYGPGPYIAREADESLFEALRAGEYVLVLGPGGSGKTSLLRAIVGQHPVSAGAIKLGDSDITHLRTAERARRGVAIVPQGREIFPLLTVEENLETGFAPLPPQSVQLTCVGMRIFTSVPATASSSDSSRL